MNVNTNLPKLDYLLAFEAVAELQSITQAAQNLNISESAISRKIRLIENHYDKAFFIRRKQSIRLSPEGREFLDKITPHLQALRDISNDLRGKPPSQTVRIAATNSVASLWLLPKLRELREINPNINITLVASDDDEASLSGDNDLIILRGDGDWPGFDAELLFGETIFPVCAPSYIEQNGDIPNVHALASQQLIEVSSSHREWMNWRNWMRYMGEEAKEIEHITNFNTYPLSIQAAQDGFGIALGWAHLVDEHLKNGRLITPLPNRSVRTKSGYYLLRKKISKNKSAIDQVASFLKTVSSQREKFSTSEQVIEI